MKLRVPGGSYVEYTADLGWTIDGDAYQQYENVTAAVKAAGSGVYTVADVQAGTGQDRYAGWSLVVAYEDLNAARTTSASSTGSRSSARERRRRTSTSAASRLPRPAT